MMAAKDIINTAMEPVRKLQEDMKTFVRNGSSVFTSPSLACYLTTDKLAEGKMQVTIRMNIDANLGQNRRDALGRHEMLRVLVSRLAARQGIALSWKLDSTRLTVIEVVVSASHVVRGAEQLSLE